MSVMNTLDTTLGFGTGLQRDSDQPNNIIVVDVPLEVNRSYDATKGDARRFDREAAIALARLRVKDRGCRQQVRQTQVQPGDEALVPRWLIQDI